MLTKKDLNWINWTVAEIKNIPTLYLTEVKKNYQSVKGIKSAERTFANTVLPLEFSAGEYENYPSYLHLLSSLSPQKEIRETAHQAEIELNQKILNLIYDPKIYQALQEFASLKTKLAKDEKRLLKDYLDFYRRLGFNLEVSKQKEVKKLDQKINKLASQFQKNINDYQDEIILPPEETAGLSENFLAILKKDKKGNYRVNLDSAQFGVFIAEAENAKKRKELIEKNSQKGGLKNLKILNEIIALKKQRAKILGYKNHSEYVLEKRMAKNPQQVKKFIDNLYKKVYKLAQKELAELAIFNQKKYNKQKITYDNFTFLLSQLRKKKFDLNPEKIREYFPLEKVLDWMFKNFGKIFAIEFEKIKTKLWHSDVFLLAVKDKKSGEILAHIACDLFPREGKYGHLCVMDWQSGAIKDSKKIKPITALICNFRQSSLKTPSLLSLGEIEGLFHEFGHALHNSLSEARFPSQSGYNVVWDFVEVPSQMMENFLYEEKTLQKISAHYQTGKSLPKKIRQAILLSENFANGLQFLRQLCLTKLDLDLYTKNIKNPAKHYAKLARESGLPHYHKSIFPASFGHIVGGYDSGYYSYLWALVYAQDIYSIFKNNGILNNKVGQKFRREILMTGSAREEILSLEKFLERKPNDKAFLKKLGIK